MAVDRDGQDVGAVVEDVLGAVAVVVVDVEDGDLAPSSLDEVLRGDRAVAEVAEAAVGVALGVVARGPAEAVDQRVAGEDRRGPRERDVHRGAGGLVGVRLSGVNVSMQ